MAAEVLHHFDLKNLIECRRNALAKGSAIKVQTSENGKWIDLLSFHEKQWHYVMTCPNKNPN